MNDFFDDIDVKPTKIKLQKANPRPIYKHAYKKEITGSFLDDAVDLNKDNADKAHRDRLMAESSQLIDDLADELIRLKGYDAREFLLANKFYELQKFNFAEKDLAEYKANICNFSDIQEFMSRDDNNIEIIPCFRDKNLLDEWMKTRAFVHTLYYQQGTGRSLKYIVKVNGKTLGMISIASDVISIGNRERYIGWNEEIKLKNLGHICIGSTIVPTQPVGFSTAAGKFLALLFYHKQFRDDWQRIYGDVLVGSTTTSLYGQTSQYLGMKKYWKCLGETTGNFTIFPLGHTYARVRDWNMNIIKYDEKMAELFKKKLKCATNSKPKHLNFFYRNTSFMDTWKRKTSIEMKNLTTEMKRGVFFAKFYENSLEYLRDEIADSDLKYRTTLDFDPEDTNGIFEYWKRKWGKGRFERLLRESPDDQRLTEQFYYDISDCNTEEDFIEKYKID